MPRGERWARGCGSGIGYSGYTAELDYGSGVKIGNWLEDEAEAVQASTGTHYLGFGMVFKDGTTHKATFTEAGKAGAELEAAYQRHDLKYKDNNQIDKEHIFSHEEAWHPPSSCYASLHQLTYSDGLAGSTPKVQTYIWSGKKANDLKVPLSTMITHRQSHKQKQWQEDEDGGDAYSTTTRSASMAVAASTATPAPSVKTTPPTCDNGSPAQIGRKPTGVFAQECQKTYHAIGLRLPS